MFLKKKYFSPFCLKQLFFLLVAGLCFFSAQGQRGIGTNQPNPSAVLELVSSNRGFLAPKIILTNSSSLAPIAGTASSTHNGLLVYNTNPSTANGLEGTGYYFWDGGSTGNWHKLANTANLNTDSLFTANGALIGARTLSQSDNNLTFNTGTGDFQVGNNNATLFVDGAESRLGMGTNIPAESLHVSGTARLTGALFDATNTAGTVNQMLSTTTTGTRWIDATEFVTQTTALPTAAVAGASYVVSQTGFLNLFNGSTRFVFGALAATPANLGVTSAAFSPSSYTLTSGTNITGGTYTVNLTNSGGTAGNLNLTTNDLSLSGAAQGTARSITAVSPSSLSLAANGGTGTATYTFNVNSPSSGALTGAWSNNGLSATANANVTVNTPANLGVTAAFSQNTYTANPNITGGTYTVNLTNSGGTAGTLNLTTNDLSLSGAAQGTARSITAVSPSSLSLAANGGTGTAIYTFNVTNPNTGNLEGIWRNNGLGVTANAQVNSTTPQPVRGAAGRMWLDRNLGATRVAISMIDSESYGYMYQWGRGNDGHQLRNSPASRFIQDGFFRTLSGADWLNTRNDTRWGGTNGTTKTVNDPCPTGFRVPTVGEWETEIAAWASVGSVGAFNSPLKIPAATWRDSGFSEGRIQDDNNSRYWTSTSVPLDPRFPNILSLSISNVSNVHSTRTNALRSHGYPVRCIQQ